MGSLGVGHDWTTSLWLFTFMHWRKKMATLQCSCLENPRDEGAWWADVYGVAQSRTRLKGLSSSSSSRTWLKRLSTHMYLQLNYDSILRHVGGSKICVDMWWFGKGSGFGICTLSVFILFLSLLLWLHTGGGKTTLTAFARSRCHH